MENPVWKKRMSVALRAAATRSCEFCRGLRVGIRAHTWGLSTTKSANGSLIVMPFLSLRAEASSLLSPRDVSSIPSAAAIRPSLTLSLWHHLLLSINLVIKCFIGPRPWILPTVEGFGTI